MTASCRIRFFYRNDDLSRRLPAHPCHRAPEGSTQQQPVVLMDVRMPDLDGITATREQLAGFLLKRTSAEADG
jgi:hypothetical protein